jgi:hypothetical protein
MTKEIIDMISHKIGAKVEADIGNKFGMRTPSHIKCRMPYYFSWAGQPFTSVVNSSSLMEYSTIHNKSMDDIESIVMDRIPLEPLNKPGCD